MMWQRIWIGLPDAGDRQPPSREAGWRYLCQCMAGASFAVGGDDTAVKLRQRDCCSENCDSEAAMDWTGCELVERVEGRCSGRPTVAGTRIFPETIVGDFDLGSPLEEIQENYPTLSLDTIKGLIEFAHARRRSAA